MGWVGGRGSVRVGGVCVDGYGKRSCMNDHLTDPASVFFTRDSRNTEHPAGRRASERGTAGPRRCGGEPSQERTPESGLMLAARPPFKHGCFCVHKRSPFIREHIGRVNVHYIHSQSRSAGVNRIHGPWESRRGRSIIFLRVSSAWQARRHGQHAGRQTGKRDGKRWVSLNLPIIVFSHNRSWRSVSSSNAQIHREYIRACVRLQQREREREREDADAVMAISGSNNVLML